ncbi:DNA primase [Planktothrix tepida]|uniref:DNA primase n=1 Tax=Planktothrix tepida PCC 9214 TaxID=671072 RepID=A0A1J1LN01_9CYAN|nr:DNA primase [Planktothrix tepida]CAD5936915.1 DNA primase [Planktothrix tepida]CUR33370.1 DNA primase [Planktothrix tepida PCC 9214]
MLTPRIHPDTIEDVKERADIYDVVSEKVVLKRRGKDFVGLCPFHEEKTPSFTVSPTKQMFYCFGCGAAGNSLKFIMDLEKRSFSEVVLELAKRYQIPVKTLEPEKRQELQRQISLREQLYEILAIATSFYQHALRQPEGLQALDYLKLKRQIKEDTIQYFQLGYAPQGWETLYDYLVEQKHFPAELVEQAGLIVPRKTGNGYYDRFRDRLMIPIQDSQGRVIGFGGRSLGDELPKYLNSPETELFDKGKTLFALDKAKNAISKQDLAIVVEGYFDAIALHRAGIENVVASLGTALSLNQVRQLVRYTESKQIILNFDADAAGNKAAERAIGEIEDLAYQGYINLRILNIPSGKDPDEFLIYNSAEDYQKLVLNSPSWIEWQIQRLLIGKSLETVAQSQQVSKVMVELLRKIDNGIQRTHYIQYCAELLSQGQSRLVPLFAKNLQTQVNKPYSDHEKQKVSSDLLTLNSERSLLEEAEVKLLRIYLHCPEYRLTIQDALEARDLQFSLAHHRFLWREITKIEEIAEKDLDSVDLILELQQVCLQENQPTKQFYHLFYLDEHTEIDIRRARLVIRSSVASIETVICQKRRDMALKLWQETDVGKEQNLAQKYYQQIDAETKWMWELKRIRDTQFDDLISVPLGGINFN